MDKIELLKSGSLGFTPFTRSTEKVAAEVLQRRQVIDLGFKALKEFHSGGMIEKFSPAVQKRRKRIRKKIRETVAAAQYESNRR